jgi:hypothetical protein
LENLKLIECFLDNENQDTNKIMKSNNLENTYFQFFNEISNFILNDDVVTFDEKVLVLMSNILIKIDSNKTLLLLNNAKILDKLICVTINVLIWNT